MKTLTLILFLIISMSTFGQDLIYEELTEETYIFLSSTTESKTLGADWLTDLYSFKFSSDSLIIVYQDGDFDIPLYLLGKLDYISNSEENPVVMGVYVNRWDGEKFTFTFTRNHLIISGFENDQIYINTYVKR